MVIRKRHRSVLLLLLLLISICGSAKKVVKNFEPQNWWVGMNYNNITIAIEGYGLAQSFVKIDYPNVKFEKTSFTKNNDIILLNITILPDAKVGKIPIQIFQKGKLVETIYFNLNEKPLSKSLENLNTNDIIYQVIVDRFANGNYSNDSPKSYLEQSKMAGVNSTYGGDLQGISDHLDYIKNFGASVIELSPLYESNLPTFSYYKDGISNHYALDERFGGEEELSELFKNAYLKELKIISTYAFHQVGNTHWLLNNEIIENSIIESNISSKYSLSLPFADPYANYINIAKKISNSIPAYCRFVNQGNEFVQKYLIQHAIWNLQTNTPVGLKIENTQYNNLLFLNSLIKAVEDDFPDVAIITDIHTDEVSELAYYSSALDCIIPIFNYDYPTAITLQKSFSSYINPQEGVMQLYKVLANDYQYNKQTVPIGFVDNGFTSRAYSSAEHDKQQLDMFYTYMVFIRKNASFMYGSEWMLRGNRNKGLGDVRSNFPGGFIGDEADGFDNKGFSNDANECKILIEKLLKWKLDNSNLFEGSLSHILPEDGVYIVYRENKDKTVFLVINNNTVLKKIDIPEVIHNNSTIKVQGFDPINNRPFSDLKNFIIQGKSAVILEIQ